MLPPLSLTQSSAERTRWPLHALRALSLVVPLLVTGFVAWMDYGATIEATETQVEKSIGILREHVSKVFEIYDLVLDQVAAHEGSQTGRPDDARALTSFLGLLQAPREEIASVGVEGPDGTPLASSAPWPPGTSAAGRDFFEAQRQRDAGTFIGKPSAGEGTQEPTVGISRRRPLKDGHFDGTIHLAVSVAYFERFFHAALPEERHFAALVDHEGQLLARDPPLRPLPRLRTSGQLQRYLAEADRKVFWTVSAVDGVERLVAYQRIGNRPVYVFYGLEKAVVLAPWLHRLAIYAALGVASALALFLIATMAERLILRLRQEMQRRERIEETVRQSQHLEALGQLTGGIAHDFNNILTVIIGNLELIGAHAATDDPKARLAAAAMSSAGRAARLVQYLLAFARRQRLQPQRIALEPLIRDSAPLHRRVLGEKITIVLDLPGHLWPCRVDPAQFEAALLNLLFNARDAMPDGGQVTVAARNRSVAVDEVPELLPGDYVVLSIADTGTGMSPAVLARAFEPFYTTKEVGKGTGLGLSMVHGFAAQSGGTARIESAPDRGTTVQMYLPRASEAPVRPAARPDRAPLPSAAPATVLVVEDDPDVRQVTGQALETAGYRPLLAANAADALRLLERQSVDVLVSDIVMPGMSGIELARAARALRRELPVLLITGYASAQDLGEADAGLEILHKPFTPVDLCARLDALAGRPRANPST